MGIFHGLAGSAPLALITLSTMGSIYDAISYILIFGFGSIIGMLIMSTLIGMPLSMASKRLKKIDRRARLVAGILSIFMGALIAYGSIVALARYA